LTEHHYTFLTEQYYHAVLVSMVVPRLRQFWRASTMGEKALVVLSFALYVWAAFDVFHFQLLGALFVKIAANGLLTLLMWSLLQPRGTGAMRDLHACTTVLIGERIRVAL
jgi:hypothetical protein